jgi:hypothetical protein
MPPSTAISMPTVIDASSLASHRIAAAISSDSAARPIGLGPRVR